MEDLGFDTARTGCMVKLSIAPVGYGPCDRNRGFREDRRASSLNRSGGDMDRVEKLARSMCVAARTDPDALVEPNFIAPGYSSIEPSQTRVPAWQRFRSAAENACLLRNRLLLVKTNHR